jgi:hypothetical protein
MKEQRPVRIVAREDAAFWMDAEGRWRNRHGRFENPRISRHFHASIRSDAQGYYLLQDHGDYLEKVYFPYADTALFVVDIIEDRDELQLVLNTGRRLGLNPENLFISNDCLYLRLGEHRVKFGGDCLVRMMRYMEFAGSECRILWRGERYTIEEGS